VVVVLLALGLTGAGAGVGGAAPTDPAPTTARLALVAQDPWTPVGGDLTFRLAVADAPTATSVSITAHQGVTSRKGYETAMADGNAGPVLSQVGIPVAALDPADDTGARTVRIGLQSPTGTRDPDRLNVRRPGVYPVEVELRDADDRVLAGFRTPLIVAEAPGQPTVAVPLAVAWVWPLVTPPTRLPDGALDRTVTAALRPDGRLGRQVAALRAVADVPVTLAPAADTLATWIELGRDDLAVGVGADTVRALSGGREHLAGTFVPVDLPALLDHDLGGAVDDQIVRADAILSAAYGGGDPGSRVRWVAPASTAAVTRARVAGAATVVVDAADLTPTAEPRLTPALPVTLRAPVLGGPETVTGLVTEPSVQGFLAGDQPAALRAQTVLGDLAVIALEAPSSPRVITVVTPADLDAPAELFTALLTGLRDNPFLRPVTASTAAGEIAPDPVVRTLADPAPGDAPVGAADYRAHRARLDAYARIVGVTDTPDPSVAAADRNLLSSVSSVVDRTGVPGGSAAYLRAVDRTVDDYLARIEVPSPGTITLTSRSGEIPLTFRNGTGGPVRVRVSLASDRLVFPDGADLEVDLPQRSTTVRVAVESRGSGTFPVDLGVTSPDGVLTISQERFQVRSTYVSRVGLVLLVSAAVVLAGWWGLDIRRRRRRRRRAATGDPA